MIFQGARARAIAGSEMQPRVDATNFAQILGIVVRITTLSARAVLQSYSNVMISLKDNVHFCNRKLQ